MLTRAVTAVTATFTRAATAATAEGTTGVAVRVLQRILALTACVWHNWHTGQPVMRSLTAYDH